MKRVWTWMVAGLAIVLLSGSFALAAYPSKAVEFIAPANPGAAGISPVGRAPRCCRRRRSFLCRLPCRTSRAASAPWCGTTS